MRHWSPERVAQAAGARLAASPPPAGDHPPGPARVTIDSREVAAGDLFAGLPGRTHDGGRFAAGALAAGAWGVLVGPAHVEACRQAGAAGALLVADDPLAALQALARGWRRELGAQTIAITGSTGKTSTKDILAALLAPARRTFVSRGNFNTEIGLPLELLAAPQGTEALVLEMGMRGAGQIAELATIAEPDVGVIVNIGPAHLELLGSVEAIAAAKAELIADLHDGATAVIPAGEPLLEPHRRADIATITFGPGGDVALAGQDGAGGVRIDVLGEPISLRLDFQQAHLRGNLLAAVAAAHAIGVRPDGAVSVAFSGRRGDRHLLANGITVIDDCYNANPMSMRAALDDLAETAGEGRRVAVLGDMLELGAQESAYHAEVGEHARARGVDVLVAVGPRSAAAAAAFGAGRERHEAPDAAGAAALVPALVRAGDTVLVKASRGIGLERVTEALAEALGGARTSRSATGEAS